MDVTGGHIAARWPVSVHAHVRLMRMRIVCAVARLLFQLELTLLCGHPRLPGVVSRRNTNDLSGQCFLNLVSAAPSVRWR